DVDAELANAVDDRACATDRSRRSVERRQEAVAGGVDLATAEPGELAPDDRVMPFEEVAPGAVAELERLRGRADDVSEEHGCEHAVRLDVVPAPRFPDVAEEASRLDRDRMTGATERKVAYPRELEVPRSGNPLRQVARSLRRHDFVVGPLKN